ncbi:actin cytoskeleton-regulatory complex protein PAN1-like [Pipra filicauda]|uniref:Actin cytoskeleton-regulatory complex protein PAN1-like n=1 Tax=Pipra filicauda TaxID=649802 RepID=A0A7R5KY96_9PASS|nr:actin cytoskeleton-regulatory complex protein PAN1-like [Pipra filicauda]
MALSALWRRSVSWRSALTRLVQLFRSPQSSGTKGSANLPPPAPLASSPGAAVPSSTAQGGPQGSGKPLAGADQRAPQGQLQPYDHQGRAVAPVPPARHSQRSPASSANPSGTPLGSGSPPDRSTPMDVDVTPALNISLASDVSMEEDAPRGCDLSLATDVSMEEDTARGCDLSLASDVSMEEDAPRGCDLSLASDVAMEEDTSPPRHTTASPSAALQLQAIREPGVTPASRALLSGKVLPQGTQGHLACSPGAAGTSQDGGSSSVPVPTDRGDTKLERRGAKRKRGSEPGPAIKIKAPAAGAGAGRLA